MATTNYSSIHHSHQRYWKRTDEPQLGWWPWGWLALLGLLLLFLIGALVIAPHMQKQTAEAVTQRLAAHNVTVLDYDGDGQQVSVTGIAEAPDQQLLLNSATSSRCDTWAGKLTCPTQVNLELSEPVAPPVAPPVAQPTEVVAVKPRLHNFEATKTTDGIVLTGEVSTNAIHQQFENQARQRFTQVDNQLTISGELGAQSDTQAQARALSVLASLQRGNARWQQGVFSASGMVESELKATAEGAFNSPGSDLNLGDLTLTVLRAVNECNQATKDALNSATVKFATGSAAIDAASKPLLQTLADITVTCPGVLTIEGHTDSVGNEAANQTLSQSRADAVRSALIGLGVDQQRLTAVGLGESQPVASNETPDGRAANRRIVMVFAEETP